MQNHDCSKELRDADLAATPARIATMQLFELHKKPLDAQHLIDHLQKELAVDRVTVFRMLNTFVEKSLITKLEFGEGKARYELAGHDHHHLICEICARVEDFEDTLLPKLELDIHKKTGFFVKNHTMEFFGICRACLHKLK